MIRQTILLLVLTMVAQTVLVNKKCQYTYSLNNNNAFSQFPELTTNVLLSKPKQISLQYVVTNYSGGKSHLVTRVLINGEQHKQFRAISGNTIYHTNSVSSSVLLGVGSYQIKVQYRTPGQFQNIGLSDWNTAELTVRY